MRVAVIDIGSNSIKLLVASRAPDGSLVEVRSHALDVRISKGIGSERPRLDRNAMARGIVAVTSLAAEAKALGAARTLAVATSAVRDASNGQEFRDRARSATGIELRILTGPEEASLIGRGLTTDPALRSLRDFHVYDLGGGSLECLSFRDRTLESAVSLPLGCVRLTEKFVAHPSAPLGGAASREIDRYGKDALAGSGFALPVPPGFAVVGTGGTLTTVCAVDAATLNVPLAEANPLIEISLLRDILAKVASLDLAGRKAIRGLPHARADVFPAALVTLLALADLGSIRAFHHSLRNLRWGVAAEYFA